MPIIEGLAKAYAEITNKFHRPGNGIYNPNEFQGAVSVTKDHPFYKATIPEWLYKPPFGYPLNKNVVDIRRLGASSYVSSVTETITAQIQSMDWKINGRKGKKIPDDIIEKTENFFYNPNSNPNESLDDILHMYSMDLLELNIGVIEKAHNRKGEFKEMYPRDAGTFTKNPDIHGILPEERAYYQYSWHTGSRPIAFDRHEIVYTVARPRTNSIYGLSAIETLYEVLQLLVYGIESNLEYFSDNNVPKGVMKMINASKEDIEAFKLMWNENMRKRDPAGRWRKAYHKMPIMNSDGAFERVGFNNIELEMIEQQKWFSKLVWACFGITPTELGFMEDASRASAVTETAIFKRKALIPLLTRIEYSFTNSIIKDLPWIKGTEWEDVVQFEFDKFDLQEELSKADLYTKQINAGLKTVNEIRTVDMNMEPHKDGDFLKGSPAMLSSTGMPQNTQQLNQQEAGKKKEENKQKKEDKPNVETKGQPYTSLILQSDEILDEKRLAKKFNESIAEVENIILIALKREGGGKYPINEIKALDLDFTKRVTGMFNLNAINDAMTEVIRVSFLEGQDIIGRKIGINLIPNQKAVQFLEDYNLGLIQSLETEMKDDLKAELQRGLINREQLGKLTARVKKVMNTSQNRAATIARTEVNRAKNVGELDAWRQSGIKVKKQWYNPSPEHRICVELVKDKPIPIDSVFVTKFGETFDSPPAHPNCRSELKFFDVKGEEL